MKPIGTASPTAIRTKAALGLSAVAIPLGYPIATGFSVGNVFQVLALILLLPAVRLMNVRQLSMVAVIWCGILCSAAFLAFRYNVEPQYLQIAYFFAVALQLAALLAAAGTVDDVRRVIRTPVNIAAFSALGIAVAEILLRPQPMLTLFFQDKSHGAVAFIILSSLTLWVNDNVGRFFLAGAVLATAAGTGSRLVVLAAPFFVLAVLVEYRRTRRLAATPLTVFLHHVVLLGFPLGIARVLGSGLTTVLADRIANLNDAALGAHFELIRLATVLKLHDPLIAVFGVGPGGFGPALLSEGIDLHRLQALDPGAFAALTGGFAPIHSATISLMVEYPIWVSAAVLIFWIRCAQGLWRRRCWTLLIAQAQLVAVTTFYSSHNEYFYWVAMGTFALAAFGPANLASPTDRARRSHESLEAASQAPRFTASRA